jgi:uncharacterized membrane protein
MMVAATATVKIMTKMAMLLVLLLVMMMLNHRSSFQTVLQRCWQSFFPGLNFTTSSFPLSVGYCNLFIVPSETPSSTLETS